MTNAVIKFKNGDKIVVKADLIGSQGNFAEVWNGEQLVAKVREELLDAYYLIPKKENPEVK